MLLFSTNLRGLFRWVAHDITPRAEATAARKQRFRDSFGFNYRQSGTPAPCSKWR